MQSCAGPGNEAITSSIYNSANVNLCTCLSVAVSYLLTTVLISAAQRPVRVVVLRGGEQMVLSLTPQRWAGKGLLGYVDTLKLAITFALLCRVCSVQLNTPCV